MSNIKIERMQALIQSAQQGNKAALDAAVEANMALVHMALKEMNARNDDDLYQEAVIGLIAAIKRYNSGHWLSYAMKWIKGAIARARKRKNVINLPVGGDGKIRQTATALRKVTTESNVSINEAAQLLGVDSALAARIAAVEAPVSHIDTDTAIQVDGGYEAIESRSECAFYLSVLDDLDREVIGRYYGVDGHEGSESMSAIAERLGISVRKGYQAKTRALAVMEAAAKLN
jgi:RNA polymerase sigma factor (sigma-70 family)